MKAFQADQATLKLQLTLQLNYLTTKDTGQYAIFKSSLYG